MLLRAILDTTQQRPLTQIARMPGVNEVYRLTQHTYDRRSRDSVATLFLTRIGARVEIVYSATFGGKPLVYALSPERAQHFVSALRQAGFDQLADQDDLPDYDSTDSWLLERAAGAYTHSVILAPDLAIGRHEQVVEAVLLYLPEALRPVT